MNTRIVKRIFMAGAIFCAIGAQAQNPAVIEMQMQVRYLSDDKLEGRATGSNGEELAAQFISDAFKRYGVAPAGDHQTYLQAFEARAGKLPEGPNFIKAGEQWQIDHLRYPHPMTGNGTVTGMVVAAGFGISAPDLGYDDYAHLDVQGKIVLIKTSSPDGTHPHSRYIQYNDERKKIQLAASKGATGVLFYNIDSNYTLPAPDYRRNVTAESIPVYVIDSNLAKDIQFHHEITVSTNLQEETRIGHNVIGYIDNNAVNTIVIGAHYDHLGHGEIEGSLYRGGPAIHNGADDNASGIALMLQLAQALQRSDLKNNNYLFIAFSGEEMGLFGSKAFVNSPLMQGYTLNYMLNYDMVGRMDTSMTVIINGTGTSTEWNILPQLVTEPLKITTTKSGIGPSDQTSFYLKDIPVLHFFTGSHTDYHKPSDDEPLINYTGMQMISDYSMRLIRELDDNGKIAFTKTQDNNNENAPRFTVTMGVVPDYAYSGKGMRVDGVTDGKPAQKAGVSAGDIIIKLGAFDVPDMMGYMQALSKFTKGQTTTVTLIRDKETLELSVSF